MVHNINRIAGLFPVLLCTHCGLQDPLLFRAGSSLMAPLLMVAQGGTSRPYATAMGSDGNLWVAGTTTGDMGGRKTSSNPALGDVYVAKINPSSGLIWVHQFQGVSALSVSLQVDSAGMSYVSFPGTSLGATQVGMAGGAPDLITAKFDSDGSLLWLTALGNGTANGDNSEHDFAVVSGTTAYRVSTNVVSSLPGAVLSGTPGGISLLYVNRVQTDGTSVWTRELSCNLWTMVGPYSSFATSSGDLVACGDVSSSAVAACYGSQVGANNAGFSSYFAYFPASGAAPSVSWVRSSSSTTHCATDGSVFYLSSVTTQAIGTQFGTFSTGTNVLLQQLTASAGVNWTSQEGGGGASTAGGAVTLDGTTPYVHGRTAGTVGTQLGTHGTGDGFLSQYNAATGARVWSRQLGGGVGTTTTSYYGGQWTENGRILSGTTSGVLPGTLHGSHGTQDVYAATFDSSGTFLALHQFGGGTGTQSYILSGVSQGGYSYFLANIGGSFSDSTCSLSGSVGTNSLIVFKMDEQSGNIAWCRQIGAGSGSSFSTSISSGMRVLSDGRVAITGALTGGQLPMGSTASSSQNGFVVVLRSDGSL